ncbi:unnamed protein product, partial [Symbiodinium sp. KB8]
AQPCGPASPTSCGVVFRAPFGPAQLTDVRRDAGKEVFRGEVQGSRRRLKKSEDWLRQRE